MKITITLTEAEKAGIINYLKEVDEITNQSTQKGIDFAVELECKNRLYHALRDRREAISDHVIGMENEAIDKYNNDREAAHNEYLNSKDGEGC